MLDVDVESQTEPTTRRWTVEEYYRLGEMGMFDDQRVELIDGQIIEMPPRKDIHSATVSLVLRRMIYLFGEGYSVRGENPVHLSENSEPEPDIAVVRGSDRDFMRGGHPTSAVLVIEVSDSSLRYDRNTKGSLYAAAGILDYWIINLRENQIEIHRTPIADATTKYGHRYSEIVAIKSPGLVSPLALPAAQIPAADLLP